MICPQCKENNLPGAVLCSGCGRKLEYRFCHKCGKEVRPKAKFCSSCGGKLMDVPSFGPGDPRAQSLRDRTMSLKQQFGNMIRKGNYKQVLRDKNNPATQALIDFIAWGINNFFGFAAFIGAITVLGFLLGGWGVILTLALTYVYAVHKKEIQEKIRQMKGEFLTEPPREAERYYQIDERCNGCGICLNYCASQAIVRISDKYVIDQTRCNQCGLCRDECPSNAIWIKR